jgi:hypothetical protein
MGTKAHYEKNKARILARQKEYYERNKKRILVRQHQYVATHKEKHRATCKRWAKKNKKKMAAYYSRWRKENHEKVRLKDKKYRDGLRDECFVAYGNKCACCGETHKEFFAMDHKAGGGHAHRKSEKMLQQGCGIHMWLKKHGYPKDFQILCHNCNSSRGYFGYCPHDRERVGTVGSSVH